MRRGIGNGDGGYVIIESKKGVQRRVLTENLGEIGLS